MTTTTTNTPRKAEPMTTGSKVAILCVAVLCAVALLSPVIESAGDTIVLDAAITKTCWDRHGFNFIGRWSCRSTLHGIGPIGLGFMCGFAKSKQDICTNADELADENKHR